MKNRRIEVRVGRTISTGDYESYRIDVGLAEDIGDSKSLNDAYHDLFAEVGKQLLVNSESAGKGRERQESRQAGAGRSDSSRFRGR